MRGDVFVQPWTDDPDRRFEVGAVLRTEPPERGPLRVAEASFAGPKLVVRFEGVEDRAAAEALRGTHLVISAADRPELDDPDEFYDSDLVGLVVRTVSGQELGPVREVAHLGAADYLVVKIGGADRLIPFVAAIVPRVDVFAGAIEIDPPEGLLDL